MELQLKAKLFNIFKAKDFEDKTSGQVTSGKWKLQFLIQRDLGGTQQNVIEDVSIPDTLYTKYKDMVGKDIVVTVGAMAKSNKVILYGIE